MLSKHFKTKQLLLGWVLIGIVGNLMGHGVAGDTFVRIPNRYRSNQSPVDAWMAIDQLQNCAHENEARVKTWQEQQRSYRYKHMQVSSEVDANCYMQLWFFPDLYHPLHCAPDQLFYVLPQIGLQDQNADLAYVQYVDENLAIDSGYWAQACTIQAGQILLRENYDGRGQGIRVEKIDFQARSFRAYNLDVADDHTYLVTQYNIVIHNSNLGPDLVYSNATKGCEVAAVTGVFATIAGWLGGFGSTTSSGGLCTIGFSAAASAPVLIAAGTIGVGFMAWKAFDWFGSKHVRYTQRFDTFSIQRTIDVIHQLPGSCGTGNMQLPEKSCLPCGKILAQQPTDPQPICAIRLKEQSPKDRPVQVKQIPVTSCPTSQARPQSQRDSENASTVCSTAGRGVLACDADERNSNESNLIPKIEADRKELSDEDVKNIITDFTSKANKCRKKRSKIFIKEAGDFAEANKDFDSIPLDAVKELDDINGRTGALNNKWNLTVREKSEDSRLTLEFYNSENGRRIKIRYGNKNTVGT